MTAEEIQKLYEDKEYRQVVQAMEELRREHAVEPGQLTLNEAWSYYQLGEYDAADRIQHETFDHFGFGHPIGKSVWLLSAHLYERRGNLEGAETFLKHLPVSLARDNLWVTVLISQQRRGALIDPIQVVEFATQAIKRVPYGVVDGHIVNNVAWLLHGARQQVNVKPFLPILPGLIEMATGIYKATGAAKNHQAGVLFRAASIFLEVPDLVRPALWIIDQCITQWTELVALQGGERYAQNLRGAQELREQILARLGS